MFKRILATALAIAAGSIVFIGYLYPHPVVVYMRDQLIHWAVVVAAFAFILGFFNVLRVHLNRIVRGGKGVVYSSTLVLAAIVTLALTFVGFMAPIVGKSPLVNTLMATNDFWFQNVLSPLQATVAGLVAFALALAGFRLLRTRRSGWAVWFFISAAVVLLGTLPLPEPVGGWLIWLKEEVWMDSLVVAGMRGLLIGVGLGTLLIGLRVIIGLDRPYVD